MGGTVGTSVCWSELHSQRGGGPAVPFVTVTNLNLNILFMEQYGSQAVSDTINLIFSWKHNFFVVDFEDHFYSYRK